jgi:hypothetical protein
MRMCGTLAAAARLSLKAASGIDHSGHLMDIREKAAKHTQYGGKISFTREGRLHSGKWKRTIPARTL